MTGEVVDTTGTRHILCYGCTIATPLHEFRRGSSAQHLSCLSIRYAMERQRCSVPIRISIQTTPSVTSCRVMRAQVTFKRLTMSNSDSRVYRLRTSTIIQDYSRRTLRRIIMIDTSTIIIIRWVRIRIIGLLILLIITLIGRRRSVRK